jgi:hypothetical protein
MNHHVTNTPVGLDVVLNLLVLDTHSQTLRLQFVLSLINLTVLVYSI